MSMAINFGRAGKCNKDFSFIKSPDPLNHMVLQGHLKYFSCCITTAATRPMTTKLGKVVTYYKKHQSIKSHNPLNTRSRGVFVSTTTIPMATKPSRVATYNAKLHSVRSHDPLITWYIDFDFSYKICRFKMQMLKSLPTSCCVCL